MALTLFPRALASRLTQDLALRGGLISAGTTLVALLLLTVVIWFFLIDRLESRVEESLTARHEISIANTTTFSEEERAAFRRFRKSLHVRDEGVFAWLDGEGGIISSNATGLECRDGFYDGWLDISQTLADDERVLLQKDEADPDRHDRFRFLARQRGERCLVFGRSMFEVDALRGSVLGVFLWAVPLCLIPALLISLARSWRLRERLKRLGSVVNAVASGELDARIPVAGDDDIDRLAMSANRSFDRLQDSVNALQQLTSVMAHDLRAPLNRVSMPLDLAIRANSKGETALDSLLDVETGLADARSIFDALLRISQIESGRRRAKFDAIDLSEIVAELAEIYTPVVEDSAHTLEHKISGNGVAIVQGDADLIRQAVVNLIENAIRYSPDGATIGVGVILDPTRPVVFVRDNGPGIPEAERPRVLQRLYRYEGSTNNKSGHGLGLSLVKAIVDLHDGDIELGDAKPGLLVEMRFRTP